MLRAAGIAHRVVASNYPEAPLPGATPVETVAEHAAGKAREVARRSGIPSGGAVLGADTAVIIDADVLGKPVDRDDARRMLRALSGRTHVVATGLCLIGEDGEHRLVDQTAVTFRRLGAGEIDWYLDRGEWQGRAGGYAIQGSAAALVARVDGDFSTVVGLPVGQLVELLTALGLAPWS